MKVAAKTDEFLYDMALNGDEKAAENLVNKYGDLLTFYINGYIKDMNMSEDLMIEAFSLMFAKNRISFSRDGAFKSYIYKVSRNLAIKHIKAGRIRTVSFDECGFEPQAKDFADTQLEQNETSMALYSALEKINPDYREALYLVYLDGLSYRQAGKVMSKSEKQISKLVYHGKKALRVQMEKEGFEYADN